MKLKTLKQIFTLNNNNLKFSQFLKDLDFKSDGI